MFMTPESIYILRLEFYPLNFQYMTRVLIDCDILYMLLAEGHFRPHVPLSEPLSAILEELIPVNSKFYSALLNICTTRFNVKSVRIL
jgi:hypothetical protein